MKNCVICPTHFKRRKVEKDSTTIMKDAVKNIQSSECIREFLVLIEGYAGIRFSEIKIQSFREVEQCFVEERIYSNLPGEVHVTNNFRKENIISCIYKFPISLRMDKICEKKLEEIIKEYFESMSLIVSDTALIYEEDCKERRCLNASTKNKTY